MVKRIYPTLETINGNVGKECTKCSIWKSLDDYGKHKQGLGKRASICKKCKQKRYEERADEVSKRKKEHYRDNKEAYKAYNTKYYKENREIILDRMRNFTPERRKVKNETNRRSYRKHSEKRIATVKKYSITNAEYLKKYRRDYYEKNKEKAIVYRSKNRELILRQKKEWAKNNPEKVAMYQMKRRINTKYLPDTITEEEMLKIKGVFGNKCALSNNEEDLHWDHVIPISIGHGGSTKENLIPLSGYLNNSKYNANLFEWFNANRQRFNLKEDRFIFLIDYLAELNKMTVEEYRRYVYWCHDNPRDFSSKEAK